MIRLLRLLRILSVVTRHGLDEIALSNLRHPGLQRLVRAMARSRRLTRPRGERLRLALEDLGPIFVKFGQLLSTRRDLIPTDVADELARLQDRVPPFDSVLAVREIERGLGHPLATMFAQFDHTPVASASIAQVHFAVLHPTPPSDGPAPSPLATEAATMAAPHDDGGLPPIDAVSTAAAAAPPRARIAARWAGRQVAVKVLRPGTRAMIEKDLGLLEAAAVLIERLWKDGKRLRPREVVAEFRKHLVDELDLTREAANASQLRRNFADSKILRVPEMYWEGCRENVIVMERMRGIPVGQIDRLRAAGIDLKKLSATGVEIFFTQVFRDGFFHADMHPGNIYVGDEGEDHGRWIALDFGIVGTLTDVDRNYLAQNFLAFFRRDYRRVATVHVESGWVPANTRVDELESAIRSVCEPIIDRPLAEISFSQVLLRLFAASRRFQVEIQPQLVLLQKTMLNIEGLGRQLDPDLDLWATAKPYLERWMVGQIGLRGFQQNTRWEAAQWSALLPQLPRLLHQRLSAKDATAQVAAELRRLRLETRQRNRLGVITVTLLAALTLMLMWVFIGLPLPGRLL